MLVSPSRRPLVAIARILSATPGVRIVATHADDCPARESHDADDCRCEAVYRLVRPAKGGARR